MKKCPYCSEDIQDIAKKCRYCGEWLKNDEPGKTMVSSMPSHANPSPIRKFNFGKTFLYAFIATESFIVILLGITGMFEENTSEIFFGILGSLIFAALIGLVVTFIVKWIKGGDDSSENALSIEEASKYKGLEGWLTLVILGLIISLGYNSYYFYEALNSFSSEKLAIVDVIIGLVFLVFNIYLIYLFFSKKRIFPTWYIVFLLVNMVLSVIAFISMNGADGTGEDAGRAMLGVIIWVPYMLRSKRVRATFTE